jgi:hypothetical protein
MFGGGGLNSGGAYIRRFTVLEQDFVGRDATIPENI